MEKKIKLVIKPDKIDCIKWQECYIKTLKLIKTYPVMTVKAYNYLGEKRLVLNTEFEKNINIKNLRHWDICGNIELKTRADIFSLYYDLSNYTENYCSKHNNILFAYFNQEKLCYIFNEDTKGNDYQKLILAISLLIENYFPDGTILTGNFNKKEVKISLEYLEDVFGKKFNYPTLMNPKFFFDYLNNELNTIDIIKNILIHFLGEQNELEDFLFTKFDIGIMKKYFKELLRENNYTVDSKMSLEIYILWLNQTANLEMLLKLFCIDPDGPQYNIKKLIATLISIGIFKYNCSKNYFEVIKKIKNNSSFLFENILINELSIFEKINIGINDKVLFKLLDKYFPLKKIELFIFFQEKSTEIKKKINQIDTNKLKVLADQGIDDYYFQIIEENFNKIFINKNKAYDLDEDLEKLENIFAVKMIKNIQDKYKFLVSLINKRKQPLTESTWRKIQVLENEDIINFLILIYLNTSQVNLFINVREYLTENLDYLKSKLEELKLIN